MSLVYRGTSSDDVHFNVTERRVYNAPAFDVTGVEVPGRSGDILNSQERFKNKAIVYTGFIRSSDFPGDTTWERLSKGLRTIKAWVCGDAGKYHDLTDDYDPGFVRRAFVSGETAISEVLDRPDGATITITFMAEPYMYEESDPIELPETGTASGAIASFEGVAAPLQSLKFNIEPSQDLHGYSYPWPGGGNINKLPSPTATSKTVNGITIAVNNGVYSISGTATALAEIIFDLPSEVTYDNTYKCAFLNTAANSGVTVYWRYNSTNGTSYGFGGGTNRVAEYSSSGTFNKVRFVITNGTAISGTLTTSPVLCLKSVTTPTSFSPYSNICPISGWSQVDAWQTGGNLLNYDAWKTVGHTRTTAVFENNGVTLTATGTDGFTNYLTADFPVDARIPVKVGEPITLSWDTPDTAVAAQVYIFPNGATAGLVSTPAATKKLTYTPTAGITYVTFRLGVTTNGTTVHYKNLMVNFGTAAAAYTPFVSKTPITISLGQTVYGGTVDALAGEGEFAAVVIDGNSTVAGNATSGFYVAAHDMLRKTNYTTADIICDRLPTLASNWSLAGNNCGISGYGSPSSYLGQNWIYFATGDPNITTSAQAKTWLASNPLTVVYRLTSPTTFSTTPVSVSSLLGQNNIWCNTGDTEVVYVEPTENPTEWPSKPRLEITMAGAGTLTVNGKTWSIGAYTGTLICDSEIMDWYDASNLKNSLVSGDGFPEFQPGENVITYTGGITKVVAKPRWRTL